MQEGIERGTRTDLIAGGLIQSMGEWTKAKVLLKGGDRIKGDERILGDSDFVMDVLRASEEKLELKYQLKAQGIDFESLTRRVASLFEIMPEE